MSLRFTPRAQRKKRVVMRTSGFTKRCSVNGAFGESDGEWVEDIFKVSPIHKIAPRCPQKWRLFCRKGVGLDTTRPNAQLPSNFRQPSKPANRRQRSDGTARTFQKQRTGMECKLKSSRTSSW